MTKILEIFILSGLSYLIYALCMGRNVSYVIRKNYLLLSIIASGIIPFIEIPVEVTVTQEIYDVLQYEPYGNNEYINFLPYVYVVGASLKGIIFFMQFLAIKKNLVKNVTSKYNYKGAQVFECARNKGNEFSFFWMISISDSLTSKEKTLILEHELSHVRHKHSLEKVILSFIKVVMWFNPFVYIAAIHIEELQEYEADFDVIQSGADRKEYVSLIVEQVITSALPVGSKFYSYFTKSRFERIINPPKNTKNIAVIPFVVLLSIMILFTMQANCLTYQDGMSIPYINSETDSLLQDGKKHLYTPDKEKFNKNKIQSVPEPDEQILMIVR